MFDANGNLVSDAQILPGYADDLDWYSDAIRNGYRQEYSFSGNTANEKSNYYFSIGYLDEKYRDVGWFGARMDDWFNFIPARITAILMCLCAFPLGMDGARAFRTVRRDHANHLSPNCAWSESAAAGALGVQLGGDHEYFGKVVQKPTIGDNLRPPELADVRRMNALMFAASGLALAIIAGIAAFF